MSAPPKDAPVQRYVFPAVKQRIKKACPSNSQPPPCTSDKKTICYVKNGLRFVERCPKPAAGEKLISYHYQIIRLLQFFLLFNFLFGFLLCGM